MLWTQRIRVPTKKTAQFLAKKVVILFKLLKKKNNCQIKSMLTDNAKNIGKNEIGARA